MIKLATNMAAFIEGTKLDLGPLDSANREDDEDGEEEDTHNRTETKPGLRPARAVLSTRPKVMSLTLRKKSIIASAL